MRYATAVIFMFFGLSIVIGSYVTIGLLFILTAVCLGGWAAYKKLLTKERSHAPWIVICFVICCALTAYYEFIDGKQGVIFWSMIVFISVLVVNHINGVVSRRRKRQFLEIALLAKKK